ncbi:hypothetical protein SAY86_020477 [Trapa natans]|uniref:ARGOS-like protein n=1 Tax=Trapa natans TaxID=22666 RepID=A0AAN7LZL8_TRANT|nr:hypothetical protein SAY86_020477 [Trapa natans]
MAMEDRERVATRGDLKRTVNYEARAVHQRRVEMKNNTSLSHNKNGRRLLRASYFTLESLSLLIVLTASLLILPLILPPLPPPPFMLLLLPVGIMAVLMVLALMPSEARDLTQAYMQ